LWLRRGQGRHGEDVEAVWSFVKTVARNVALGGANDAALLVQAYGVFGRLVILARFDLDKDESVTVPGDHIHFPGLRAVTRSDDAKAKRSNVINCQNLGPAAEWKQPTKEQRKWHR